MFLTDLKYQQGPLEIVSTGHITDMTSSPHHMTTWPGNKNKGIASEKVWTTYFFESTNDILFLGLFDYLGFNSILIILEKRKS